jgi:SAM-dependent methyltransferase
LLGNVGANLNEFDYEEKKSREKEWWEKKPAARQGLANRILNSSLIFNEERNLSNFVFPKRRMAKLIQARLGENVAADKMLIAPCGDGDDYKYIGALAREVYGIDLSDVAIAQCPAEIKTKTGDILTSGYDSEMFDIVASPLFFHHLLKIGFDPFLNEFHRVLKPGGKVVILEPSIWYPVNIITRPVKRIFNNPYGEIEEEDPFRPRLMLTALRNNGFRNVEMRAASFSHCAFPKPLAKTVNFLTRPLLNLIPFKYQGWMVIYYAEK